MPLKSSNTLSNRKKKHFLKSQAAESKPNPKPFSFFQPERLYDYDKVPEYLQDNDFIRKYYRSCYSYAESYMSFFQIHNQTGNIWTHACGTLLFVYLIFDLWTYGEYLYEDQILLTVFLCCSTYTLFFSSIFHLHICVSLEVERFWGCLDHSGISASIAGGSIAVMYLLLHCDGNVRLWWTILLATCNMVGIFGPMFPLWTAVSFRPIRTSIYLASGAAVFLPGMYYLYVNGSDKLPAMGYLISMILQYIIGALVYASRVPERFWPGKFDLVLQSHQIWHVLVVTASLTLYKGLQGLVEWRLETTTMCGIDET
jgi:adiponectin receptor